MAKDPAFLFYSSDFLSGVSDLNFTERGQYITLLCLQHQKGHLSQKMIELCCGNAAADVMAKFEQDENGLFFNARLDEEIQKRSQFTQKQKDRALLGWKKRKENNTVVDATASAGAMPKIENENRNDNVIEDNKGKGAGKTIEERMAEFKQSVMLHRGVIPDSELHKFYDYWTEYSEKGQKMRFEKEKVFDVAKRINRWKNNLKSKKTGFGNCDQPKSKTQLLFEASQKAGEKFNSGFGN